MKTLSTPNDVIIKGMSLAGIHPDDEDLHDNYLSDALDVLNETLEEWSKYGVDIPYQSKIAIPLLPNRPIYQIHRGNDADIVASPIVSIHQAVLYEETCLYTLKMISETDWSQMQHHSKEGRPTQYWINHDEERSEFGVFPIPDKAYCIELTCKQRFSETDLFEPFPEACESILKILAYQLALDFSATYDVTINPLIERKAEKMIRELLSINTQNQISMSSHEIKRQSI